MAIYTEKVTDKKTGQKIDKLVDGKKQYYIRTYITDENGKRKQITRHNKSWIGNDGKKEATAEDARLTRSTIYKEKQKEIQRATTITVNEAFEEMVQEEILYNKNSEATRMTNRDRYNCHIKKNLGYKQVSKVNNNDLQNLVIYMKTRTENIRFINEVVNLFKRVYLFAIQKYGLDNVLKFCPLKQDRDQIIPKTMEELMNQDTILSPNDWENFVKEAEKQLNSAKDETIKLTITKLLLMYSCEYILLTRVGETQGMKMKNLVADANIYVLYEAWNKRLHKLTPLKNREARLLYLPPNLTKLFLKLFEILKKNGIADDDFIFSAVDTKNKSAPISRTTIDRYRTKICKGANINYVTNHELRHGGISNAIHNKVDASAVSDMAGHEKEIMFKTYVHTLKESNAELIKTLGSLKIPNLF